MSQSGTNTDPDAQKADPTARLQQAYEEAESRTAQILEEAVRSDAFGELLGRVTQNVIAVTKIGNDVFDLAVRNLRIAGRQDMITLGKQLARTEDKLEQVLQEVERVQDELRRRDAGDASGNGSSSSASRGASAPPSA